MLRPAAMRKILGADQRIHAAIYCPIERFAKRSSFARRFAYGGQQEPALPPNLPHWPRHPGQVENWQAMQAKGAVIQRCLASNVYHHALCVEAPRRRFQPAGGDHAALDDELIRTRST